MVQPFAPAIHKSTGATDDWPYRWILVSLLNLVYLACLPIPCEFVGVVFKCPLEVDPFCFANAYVGDGVFPFMALTEVAYPIS